MPRRKDLAIIALSFLLASVAPRGTFGDIYPFAYPYPGCIPPDHDSGEHGHGNAGLLAPSLIQAVACVDSFSRFAAYDNATTAYDINLLLNWRFTTPGYFGQQYMQASDLNALLHGLDVDYGNQLGISWTDMQLNFNYFHARDSTEYYGSFGTPENMKFPFYIGSNWFDTGTQTRVPVPLSEKNHIDIYLKHPWSIGADIYPPFDGAPDPEEDGNPATCDEIILDSTGKATTPGTANSIGASAGFKGYRSTSSMWTTVLEPDPAWSAPGGGVNQRLCHEMQHLLDASRTGAAAGWNGEMRSMAAEYLMGANLDVSVRPAFNSVIDLPFFTTQTNLGYHHWYLWSTYLLQQFAGDPVKIEDDLYYKWLRTLKCDTCAVTPSNWNLQMKGLAKALGGSEYSAYGLGGTGAERLRSVFHNASIAKWVNNPSASFYGGRYGYSQGVIPSRTGQATLFDNSGNYCNRVSATERARKYKVASARLASDSSLVNYTWCVTDSFTAYDCNPDPASTFLAPRTSCDPTSIGFYSADYIQFESDPYFESGTPYTLRFKFWWNPSRTSGTTTGKNYYPRIAAVTYPIKSDSLYLYGAEAIQVIEGSTDTNRGFGLVSIPNFGASVKSVVVIIDVGERTVLTSSFPDTMQYAYSFGVDQNAAPTQGNAPIDLVAFRPGGGSIDSLAWSDPGNCGTAGYYIQRANGKQSLMVTIDSTSAGAYGKSYTPAFGNSIQYYRVLSKGTQCSSNLASCGGNVSVTDTLSGNLYLSGDLTVPWSDTLFVSAGTRVRARPGFDSLHQGVEPGKVEVIVYGVIRALGSAADSIWWTSASASPTPGDWRGISLNLNPCTDPRSYFDYNVILYATHGIQLTCVSATIDHTRVQHSQFYGIYATNQGKSTIQNAILEQNHGAELAAVAGASLRVLNSHLHYSPGLSAGAVDDGAVYSTGGRGSLNGCRIAGVGMGVYCVGATSSPDLRGGGTTGANFGRNDILEFRYYGVRALDFASPNLGSGNNGADSTAGRNNIFSRYDSTTLYVLNGTTNALSAKYNYWGAATPEPSRFVGAVDPGLGSNQYLTSFESPAGPSFIYPGYLPSGVLGGPAELLELAAEKEDAGDLAGAIAGYKNVVATYPTDPLVAQAVFAIGDLSVAREDAGRDLGYLASLTSSSYPLVRNSASRILPRVELYAGHVYESRRHYERLLDDPAFSRGGILLEMAVGDAFVLKDNSGARAAIEALQNCCAEYGLLKHARAMLEEFLGKDVWIALPAPTAGVSINKIVSEPELAQNYPNPLNPSTKFSFTIPERAQVSVRIFDVRGRLVRTVVDEMLPAGTHVRSWNGISDNGREVASGVYYYRLDTMGKRIARKLIVLK
jgi:hypothetical protein